MSATFAHILRNQLRKDLKQHGRRLGAAVTPLFFFAVVVALFPLAMSPDPNWLTTIAAPVVWIAALLASMLSLQTLFRGDFDDGSLALMALSPVPLWWHVLARQIGHWLVTGLPLVLLSPLAAYSLNLADGSYPVLMLSLLLGTLTLSALGAIGAALTVSIGQGGLLFAVLVLPLIVPTLIFGTYATGVAGDGGDPGAALNALVALCILASGLAPFATAAALRVSLD